MSKKCIKCEVNDARLAAVSEASALRAQAALFAEGVQEQIEFLEKLDDLPERYNKLVALCEAAIADLDCEGPCTKRHREALAAITAEKVKPAGYKVEATHNVTATGPDSPMGPAKPAGRILTIGDPR